MENPDASSTLLGLLPLALLVLIIYGIYRAIRPKAPGADVHQASALHGVEGWLAFYIIASRYIGPIVGAATLNTEFMKIKEGYPEFYASDPFSTYMRCLWAYLAVITAVSWWSTSKLKTEFVPASVSITIWTLAGSALLTPVIILVLFTQVLGAPLQGNMSEIVTGSIQTIFASTVWIVYFKRSQRVKNTYFARSNVAASSPVSVPAEGSRSIPKAITPQLKSSHAPIKSSTTGRDHRPDTVPNPYTQEAGSKALGIREPDSTARETPLDPDRVYALALAEFEGPERNQGRWGRLFAHYEGNEAAAKAAYIRETAEYIKRSQASA